MGAGITHLRREGRRLRRLLGRECLWPGHAAGAKLTSVSAGNCHNCGLSLQDQPHLEDGSVYRPVRWAGAYRTANFLLGGSAIGNRSATVRNSFTSLRPIGLEALCLTSYHGIVPPQLARVADPLLAVVVAQSPRSIPEIWDLHSYARCSSTSS